MDSGGRIMEYKDAAMFINGIEAQEARWFASPQQLFEHLESSKTPSIHSTSLVFPTQECYQGDESGIDKGDAVPGHEFAESTLPPLLSTPEEIQPEYK